MNKILSIALVLTLGSSSALAQPLIADFEDLPLAPNSAHSSGPFSSRGAAFNNTSGPFGWSGFAYSNKTDTTTASYTNDLSAITGAGAGGSSNYGVAYYSSFDPVPTITLPAGRSFESINIANTTYAYLSMRDGDGFAKQFGGAGGNDPDFLKLMITGLDASGASVGTIDFYLADFRFSDNAQDYIVNGWTNVDLTPLAAARKASFTLASSDVGSFGINTPTYFAIDNLATVPEPASVGLVGLALVIVLRRTRH